MTDFKAYGWGLHNEQDNRDAFYRVLIVPVTKAVLVNFGKRGTVGQFRDFYYERPEDARDKAATVTSQKLKRGYTLVKDLTTVRLYAAEMEKLSRGHNGEMTAGVRREMFRRFIRAREDPHD